VADGGKLADKAVDDGCGINSFACQRCMASMLSIMIKEPKPTKIVMIVHYAKSTIHLVTDIYAFAR
jgi:hypothetical protein